MGLQIQVLHIEKRHSISSGLNRHITRQQFVIEGGTRVISTWVPDNADVEKTAGNKEYISRSALTPDGNSINLTLQQAIDRRIKDAGVKPRKNQNTCLEMIFSGSHETMSNMSPEELNQWAEDTVAWAQKTWGKENVVSAILHVDETTPHIHMIVVPIVSGQSRRTQRKQATPQQSRKRRKNYNIDHNKLRLCANEVYTPGNLYRYHDNYAAEVSKNYGLQRGIIAMPGSKRKHTTSIEYNRELLRQETELQNQISELTADYQEKQVRSEALSMQIEKNLKSLDHQRAGEKLEKAKKYINNMFFLNPNMEDWEKNSHEMIDAGISYKKMQAVFMHGAQQDVSIPILYNNTKYQMTATVKLAKDAEGKMRVWYNGQRLNAFRQDCIRIIQQSLGPPKKPHL